MVSSLTDSGFFFPNSPRYVESAASNCCLFAAFSLLKGEQRESSAEKTEPSLRSSGDVSFGVLSLGFGVQRRCLSP